MLSSQCLFCDHINPAGAKFCNDCGSPLLFKRCRRCQTVNDQAANKCVKCGMEFPLLSSRSEAPPVSLGTNTTAASPADSEPLPFRLDFLNEFPRPAAFTKEVTAAAQPSVASEPSFAASSPKPQPTWPAVAIDFDKLDQSREARSFDHLPKPAPSATEASAAAQASVASEPSFATVRSPAPQLARLAAVETMDERRSTSRAARVVSLLTVGLIATGIFAYYVYSNAVHPGEGQGAPAISAAPEAVNSDVSSIRPIQEIGPKASSAPSASLATGSVAVSGTVNPAPPAEADSQTTSPNGPVSTPAASAAAPVPSSPSEDRANVRDVPRPAACAEGVVALGLCSRNSKEGSK